MTAQYVTHKRWNNSSEKIVTHVKMDGIIYPVNDVIELIEKNKQKIMIKDDVGRKHTVSIKTKSEKKFMTTNPDGTKINLIDTLPSFQLYQSNPNSKNNFTRMKKIIVIASMLTVAVIILISMNLTQNTTMISQDVQNEIQAIKLVDLAIDTYDLKGISSFIEFDEINKFHANQSYVFVIEKESHIIRAHGTNPLLIGTSSMDLVDPNGLNIGKLLDDNVTFEGVWIEYTTINSETGKTEPKLSWIVLYDEYIFGVEI